MILVLAQVLSYSLLGFECDHKKRGWQMSAIYLGIVNEVETAGSLLWFYSLALNTPGSPPGPLAPAAAAAVSAATVTPAVAALVRACFRWLHWIH
jgi:hypothetical protein